MSKMNFPQELSEHGWCFINGNHYPLTQDVHLNSLREGYLSNLILDPYSNGNRYRAYTQCQYQEPEELKFGHFHAYQQTQEYNPDTGGVIREYPPINSKILSNPLFLNIIKDDIEFVKQYHHIGHPSDLSIGIHLFRYKATRESPAYSSPIWLHRDDEDVVFVHLINKSENLIGGDNIIATDGRSIETVFRLQNPLDTFVVNHKKFHAITPIGHQDKEGFSFRDIILVTFQLMEMAVKHDN
jgi:hypothetical protein